MTAPIEPDWYDDPNDPQAQRYWDGTSWSPHRRRKPNPTPRAAAVPAPAARPPIPSPSPPPPAAPPPPPPGSPGHGRSPSGTSGRRKGFLGLAVVVLVAAAVALYVGPGRKLIGDATGYFSSSTSPAAASGQASNPTRSPGAPAAPGGPHSGILAMTYDGNKTTFGYIDPGSGKYAAVASFAVRPQDLSEVVELSPDLTKFAVNRMTNGEQLAGWIDTSGHFTAVSPAVAATDFGSQPPSYSAVGFDGSGNYYYTSIATGASMEYFKVAAGSTSNPQQITPTPPGAGPVAWRNFDGGLIFQCNMGGRWLDANTRVDATSEQIVKLPVTGHTESGCPITNSAGAVNLLPQSTGTMAKDPVPSPDGRKVAFIYHNLNAQSEGDSVYVVGTDGNSTPTKLTSVANLPNLDLIGWS